MAKDHNATVSRRSFVKGSTLAALAGAAAMGASSSLFGCAPNEPMADTGSAAEAQGGWDPEREEGEVVWNTCYGCGFQVCPMKFHVADGKCTYIECHNEGDKEFGGYEPRACLRGRSMRKLLNNPDRLKYPMKRVGPRGSGEFEQISWDEAIQIIADNFKRIFDEYGTGETVLSNYSMHRFFNLVGGSLTSWGTDSNAAVMALMPHVTGSAIAEGTWDNFLGGHIMGSTPDVMRDADLVVQFSAGDAEHRSAGSGSMYNIEIARENGAKVYCIDPRMSDTMSGHPEEWIPIRPGTDGALASALNYVFVTEGTADEEFLHSHTVGYDEETMPEHLKGQNKSYKDYLLGTGYDMVAKTPEWAEPITGIPADTIKNLAHEIAAAKSCFISSTFAPQRHNNGEMAAWSVSMVPVISGHIGRPGTSNGMKSSSAYMFAPVGCVVPYDSNATVENPCKVMYPQAKIFEVLDHAAGMTAEHDGILGTDKLTKDVKIAVFRHAGNVSTACDGNYAAEVLSDESKVEFILGSSMFMGTTMTFCDIVLPDVCDYELPINMRFTMGDSTHFGLVFGKQIQEPYFECRNERDWCADLAEKFDLREEYTEGYEDFSQWVKDTYEKNKGAAIIDLPPFEEGFEKGLIEYPNDTPVVAYQDWREDIENHPMATEDGKLHIYSESIEAAWKAMTFDDPRDKIMPIPAYQPEIEGVDDLNEEYPLQFVNWKWWNGFHTVSNAVQEISQAMRHTLWINPVDAEARGIQNGDHVLCSSERGTIGIEARVTPRIMPGVVGTGTGAWQKWDENGVDQGGAANTLSARHLTPLAKGHSGNGSTNVQVVKG